MRGSAALSVPEASLGFCGERTLEPDDDRTPP